MSDPAPATREVPPGRAVPAGEAGARPAAPAASSGFRPDIQGLRALAVGMVVIYHLYPSALPGGFAGVDVFFVISGFLITGHLLREYRDTGRVSLAGFWGRRAKRLIPAAALVLTVTWLASLNLLTAARLSDTGEQIRASALYFQNWQLAANAVDYLKSADAPSPVQHFWSLSVEEQFYLIWPLLFLAAAAIAAAGAMASSARPRRPGHVPGYLAIGLLTTTVVLASLAYSRYETRVNASAAYFVTTTRIWELGAGGLLALLPAAAARRAGRLGWIGWLGLAMAVASAFVLRASMPFPGVTALLPVAGTVALIGCGSPAARLGPARLMSLAPLVWTGGISYSLYLWHFPLFTLWTAWRGHAAGALAGPALAGLAVLASWLTKAWVEDPVRRARFLSGHDWRSVSTAAAAAVPVALVAGFLVTRPAPWAGELGPGYPGAGALADAALRVPAKPVLPPLKGAKPYSMAPAYWHEGCMVAERSAAPKTCQFGDTVHPVKKVVIAGDSIAGNWVPALTLIARQQHWELITELHALCIMTPALQWFPNDYKPFTDCQRWGANVMRDLVTTIHPDLVITSGREVAVTPANHAHGDYDSAARREVGDGVAIYWRELLAHGISVLAIRETPEIAGMDVGACVLAHPGDYATACGQPTRQAITPDPPSSYAQQQMTRAGLAGRVPEIDLDSLICGPVQCSPVEGNVLVFLDYHHMTDAYGKTLAQFLAPRLLGVVPGLRLRGGEAGPQQRDRARPGARGGLAGRRCLPGRRHLAVLRAAAAGDAAAGPGGLRLAAADRDRRRPGDLRHLHAGGAGPLAAGARA